MKSSRAVREALSPAEVNMPKLLEGLGCLGTLIKKVAHAHMDYAAGALLALKNGMALRMRWKAFTDLGPDTQQRLKKDTRFASMWQLVQVLRELHICDEKMLRLRKQAGFSADACEATREAKDWINGLLGLSFPREWIEAFGFEKDDMKDAVRFMILRYDSQLQEQSRSLSAALAESGQDWKKDLMADASIDEVMAKYSTSLAKSNGAALKKAKQDMEQARGC